MDRGPQLVHPEIHHCVCARPHFSLAAPSQWPSTAVTHTKQAYSWEMRNSCDRQLSLKYFLRPWGTFLRTALQSKTLSPKCPSFLTSLLHLEPDLHHSLTTPHFLSQALFINFLPTRSYLGICASLEALHIF